MVNVNNLLKIKRVIAFITFLFFALFLIWIYQKYRNNSHPLCKDCNIILVSLDTLSANHLSCYGYERDTAPLLCGFAQKNIFFKNTYANATWTLPSHVSIFTGLFPETHGVNFYNDVLDPNIPFLPSVLKDNGYKTIFFMPSQDPALPEDSVYNRGIDYLYNSDQNSWNEALELYKENVGSKNKTFLFLHTYAVHDPYLIGSFQQMYPTEKYFDLPKSGEEIWGNFSDEFLKYFASQFSKDIYNDFHYLSDPNQVLNCIDKYRKNKEEGTSCIKIYYKEKPAVFHDYFIDFYWKQKIDTTDPDQIEYIKALYDQKIREMDATLLRSLISFLQDENIKKNTILIITSDHGEEFMEHGHISHMTIYNSNIKVPLILSLPSGFQKEISTPSQLADIFPTILDIVGIKNEFKFQGVSLQNTISGKKPQDHFIVTDGWHLQNKTILKDGWKLFLKRKEDNLIPYELYKIDSDPQESDNVMFSNLDIVSNLKDKYDEIVNEYK